jgi:hypothetical protein
MSIVTVDEFKLYLQIKVADVTMDTLLQSLIDGAEDSIKVQGLKFVAVAIANEKHDYSEVLYPDYYPINSVTSLTVDDVVLVEDTDFFVYPNFIRIDYESENFKSVALTYNAGFTTVPEDVKIAIKHLAAYDLKANHPVEPNTRGELDSRLLLEAQRKLRNYLRVCL